MKAGEMCKTKELYGLLIDLEGSIPGVALVTDEAVAGQLCTVRLPCDDRGIFGWCFDVDNEVVGSAVETGWRCAGEANCGRKMVVDVPVSYPFDERLSWRKVVGIALRSLDQVDRGVGVGLDRSESGVFRIGPVLNREESNGLIRNRVIAQFEFGDNEVRVTAGICRGKEMRDGVVRRLQERSG